MPAGPTLKTVKKPGRSLPTSMRTRSPVRRRTWSGGGGTFFMSRVRRPGRRLRMGRGHGYVRVRVDLAADDQPQVDRALLAVGLVRWSVRRRASARLPSQLRS